jgi:gluconolactonase
MKTNSAHCLAVITALLLVAQWGFGAGPLPSGEPVAAIDLSTERGLGVLRAQWRYSDAHVVQTDFLAAGNDGQPGFAPVRAYDIAPHAGGADFDDTAWPIIPPGGLSQRRGNGRLAFNWYRIRITVPETLDGLSLRGTTAVFETSVDDYAEIWVDGELARAPGQSGGSVIAGWNAANRLVVARNVKPGQPIQLAIFGANGPLSNPPTNYIWIRSAKLIFYRNVPTPVAITPSEVNVEVKRLDAAINALVPLNAKAHKLAEGFTFTEGPVWSKAGNYLLFSDPNENRIYKYSSDGQLSLFRDNSGYEGDDIAEYRQPGSNGLAFDPQSRLSINQHGNRRVVRLEADGTPSIIAERFEGKRLNSPNDLVYRSDGALFFTDPAFGLPKVDQDPRKDLPFQGVYSLYKGKLRLLTKDLWGPNGIALSPDERYFYVGNWDEKKKIVMRYEVRPDASVSNGTLFFDMTSAPGEDAIDGIKVDEKGNVYVSGPGGLWVLSPAGKHLGMIVPPLHPHNMAWGDEDGKSLYLAARSGLYKVRLNVRGAGIF